MPIYMSGHAKPPHPAAVTPELRAARARWEASMPQHRLAWKAQWEAHARGCKAAADAMRDAERTQSAYQLQLQRTATQRRTLRRAAA